LFIFIPSSMVLSHAQQVVMYFSSLVDDILIMCFCINGVTSYFIIYDKYYLNHYMMSTYVKLSINEVEPS